MPSQKPDKSKLLKAVRSLLNTLDIRVPETDRRVTEMYLELLSGKFSKPPKMTTFKNPGYDQIILIRDIDFVSICEHHLLPFYGRAHFAYLPKDYIVGLSKVPRAVRYFALREQTQERLTQQIADFLYEKIKPRGLMLIVQATHTCATLRGVKSPARMVTSALRGEFLKDADLKEEVLKLLWHSE